MMNNILFCRRPDFIGISKCILTMLFVVLPLFLSGCSNKNSDRLDFQPIKPPVQEQGPSSTSTSTTQGNGSPDIDLMDSYPTESLLPEKHTDIQTPYGSFRLTGRWNGELTVELIQGDPYIIRALYQSGRQGKAHLFDVSFGVGGGELLGYVQSGDGKTHPVYLKLSAVVPDGTWTTEEQQDFYGMQAEVNSILSKLELMEQLPTEPVADIPAVEVKTSYFTLSYPGRYADILRAEVHEGSMVTISFYGSFDGVGELHLYDFVINGNAEAPVGFYTLADGSTVSVDVCNFQDHSTDGWSDPAKQQMQELLECINDILLALEQTGFFTY